MTEERAMLMLADHNRNALQLYRQMLEVFYYALDNGKSVQCSVLGEGDDLSCVFKVNVK